MLLVGPFEMDQIADKSLLEKINSHPGIVNIGRVLQDEVPPYILTLNVFVLPAWWEGFGNVLVQAAAMGIPVISTTGTGTIDAVSNNHNGILTTPKSETELELAMKKLLLNREITEEYGKNGLEWAKNFERTIIWNGINQLYTKR